MIWREVTTPKGWNDRNMHTTIHKGTVCDLSSPTGVMNHYAEKYLERYYLVHTKWLAVYIHRFWSSDLDPLHDHPWDNFSWIIKGGYYENLPDGQRIWRKAGFKSFRTAEEFHRIELPSYESAGKAWTIFVRFRRRRKWGFWHQDGWQPAAVQSGSDKVFA